MLIDPELLGITSARIVGSGSQKPTNHEWVLVSSIAKMMECEPIQTTTIQNMKFKRVWEFIGFDPAPEIASYSFEVLYRQLKKARNEYIKTNLNRGQNRQ